MQRYSFYSEMGNAKTKPKITSAEQEFLWEFVNEVVATDPIVKQHK